jgi:hypothetical protein
VIQEVLLECAFFIPLRRDKILSDGELHSLEVWEWLEEILLTRFTARTIAPGFYQGIYQDPDTGQKIADESRRYVVALPFSRVGEIREILAEACVRFAQKCIYLSVAGYVEFVGHSNENQNLP